MSFNKAQRLMDAYKGLDALTTFIQPALPFVNSHLTEFYTSNYWDTLLPKLLRDDLESKSVKEVKQGLGDLVSGDWMHYATSSSSSAPHESFENLKTFQDVIVATAKLQLSAMQLSTPLTKLCFNGVPIYEESVSTRELELDKIMSAKKTHEVALMSDVIKKISETGNRPDDKTGIEYLVDIGSGKGYLSSHLTLMHKFKVLAVDSSSVNTSGCEKRSAKLEKAWAQLVRRAAERQQYGQCSKRGKRWKSKSTFPLCQPDACNYEGDAPQSNHDGGESSERQINDNSADPVQITSNNLDESLSDNKLLKTLTEFVTDDFDLTTSMVENFSTSGLFGVCGLHTCGKLGVTCLRLFISNKNANFICNVPCCYNLLDENHVFLQPSSGSFHESESSENKDKKINELGNCTTDCFPLSRKLNVENSSPFCLGKNARTMSAYSLHKMVADEKGLDMHPSIFYRSVLQIIIKTALGDQYSTTMDKCEQIVGKIGRKCNNFVDYVRMGLNNLQLNTKVQVSDDEISNIYTTYAHQGKDRLLKYYLLRSLFASLVEGIILLDRLAFLLEQDNVGEAHIVQLFDASVSPRCFAIVSLKK